MTYTVNNSKMLLENSQFVCRTLRISGLTPNLLRQLIADGTVKEIVDLYSLKKEM